VLPRVLPIKERVQLGRISSGVFFRISGSIAGGPPSLGPSLLADRRHEWLRHRWFRAGTRVSERSACRVRVTATERRGVNVTSR
jgi:hypothetical protein